MSTWSNWRRRSWPRRSSAGATRATSTGKPCVYVGMTGLSVAARFANHKRGHKGNVFVLRFGTRLLPELFAHLNPMPYEAAMTMERELAEELRQAGYGVWQA